MTNKIEIIKQTIEEKARKLSAKWNFENTGRIGPLKNVKDMTREEEADEIIRRLSQPYRTPTEIISDELALIMSEEIRKEIDNEILESFRGKRTNRTC